MSTIQEQQESIPELTLHDLADMLRRTKAEQCTGQLTDGENRLCAVGVLAHELLGMPSGIPFGEHGKYSTRMKTELLKLGIERGEIWNRNDVLGWTFSEIADWLESIGL